MPTNNKTGSRKADDQSAATPSLKKAPVLVTQTQAAIKRISQRLGGPLLCYWISVNGSICHNDVVAMNEILKGQKKVRQLYVFIKSDGGSGQASLRLVNLLRRKCERLVVLAPLNCESAATMLALGADEIQMGPLAFLTRGRHVARPRPLAASITTTIACASATTSCSGSSRSGSGRRRAR